MSEHEDLALQLSRDLAAKITVEHRTDPTLFRDATVSYVDHYVTGVGPYAMWRVTREGVEMLEESAGVL